MFAKRETPVTIRLHLAEHCAQRGISVARFDHSDACNFSSANGISVCSAVTGFEPVHVGPSSC